MVKVPFALQAAGRLRHAQSRNQKRKKLPIRAMQIFDVREAGQTQAGGKGAERKESGARQRSLP